MWAIDVSLARLWYPFLFFAIKTIWKPSSRWDRSRWFTQTLRVIPIIGLIGFPVLSSRDLLCLLTALTKWKAPIKLPISVMATADIFIDAASCTSFGMEIVDWSTENCVWVWRWQNGKVSTWISSPETSGFWGEIKAAVSLCRFRCFKPASGTILG